MSVFEEEWRERFSRYGTRHRSDHLVSGWSMAGLRRRTATFERLLNRGLFPTKCSVLELGCGAGTYVRALGKRGHAVVGLDYSLPSLGRAKAGDSAGVGRYVGGSASSLPFGAGSFGAVMCIGVLQALQDPAAALAEIARVLRPGGVLLVETLNPWNPLAASRRLGACIRRRPTRLSYGSPRRIEGVMAGWGIRPIGRAGIVLAPRSLPRLGRLLEYSWVEDMCGVLPGVRSVLPQAFWITGRRL
jgi:SAM-dependent methyltransferase